MATASLELLLIVLYYYGTEEVYMKMRQLLVDFVRDNTEVPSPFIFGRHNYTLSHVVRQSVGNTVQVELKAAVSLFQMDLYTSLTVLVVLWGQTALGVRV